MSHQVQMWVVPLLAIVSGLLIFVTAKAKWEVIGGYLLLCGMFLTLWILTFRGIALR